MNDGVCLFHRDMIKGDVDLIADIGAAYKRFQILLSLEADLDVGHSYTMVVD